MRSHCTTPAGAETSLGARTATTVAIFDRFTQRKRDSTERISGQKAALEQHRRLNRALRVGRVDPLVVALLGRLAGTQLSPHFRVVGTHALYAYEATAGVRLDTDTLATHDIDLLWDSRFFCRHRGDRRHHGTSEHGAPRHVCRLQALVGQPNRARSPQTTP